MKILITDGLAKEAVEMLKKAGHEVIIDEASPEKLLQMAGDFESIIVRSRSKVTSSVIDAGKKLKVIARAGIGVDNIDVKAASMKGIVVVNAPSGSTVSVAELAIAHMLSLARSIPKATAAQKNGQWLKKELKGTELYEKTLGLIGCGRIGQATADRARAFGMKVIGFDPAMPAQLLKDLKIEPVTLEELYARSDVISIHANMTPENKNMINASTFAKMKKGVLIINCARGGFINETDLYNALKEGKVGGAGLDVFEAEPPAQSPLFTLDNVSLTPHIGANTVEGQYRAGVIVAEQVIKVLSGKQPDFAVKPK